MFLLKDKLRQVVDKKRLSKNMMWTIALNAVRKHFGYTKNTLLLDGYLSFDVLFVKSVEQHVKIKIFQEKQLLLQKINEALQSVGYNALVKDIRTK